MSGGIVKCQKQMQGFLIGNLHGKTSNHQPRLLKIENSMPCP